MAYYDQQYGSRSGRRFDCGLIFRKIQILREGRPEGREPIGSGAYGAVYYAKCDSLLCAAKSIHAIFFDNDITDPAGRQHQLDAFHRECELMSSMRHPNIVQFLGYYDDSVYDPKTQQTTKVPCLLMELLDESLTRYLERIVGSVPFHTSIDFAHDITKALDYLHNNGRIHCDLTSNNVLIIASTRAKVTDFGQSVLAKKENNYHVRGVMCPGNVNYMPPEARKDDPFFSPKIDVFSFGVLLIQILTRHFPDPKEPTMVVRNEIVPVKEVSRRGNHIGMVDSHHPLLELALYCLHDKEEDRPEFHWLTARLNDLQRIPEYDESQRDNPGPSPRPQMSTFNPDNDRRIKELMEKLNRLEDYNIDLEREVARLQQENDSLKARQRSGGGGGGYSLEQAPPIATPTPLVHNPPAHHNPLSLTHNPRTQSTSGTPTSSLTSSLSANPLPVPEFKVNGKMFRWFPCSRLPAQLYSGTAVCIRDKIYVNGQGLNGVFELDPSRNMWSALPVAPTASFALVGIRGVLTTVGGYTTQAYSEALYSLVSIVGSHAWRATYPPMKEPRINAGAIATHDYLVVAGGEIQAPRNRFVSWNVELMHIDTQQWMAVDKLPKPAKRISMASTGDHIYVVGGLTRNNQPLKEIFHVSMTNLVNSGAQGLSKALRSGTCWGSASVPVVYATCAVVNQQLLVLGGWDNQPSLAMYGMNIDSQSGQVDSWSQIGKLPLARFDGMAAVLPGQRLVVIGGRGNVPGQAGEKVLDAAEMACPE